MIIFSISENEEDVLDGYENRVNCYIIKLDEMHRFEEVVQSLFDFWIHIVTLPDLRKENFLLKGE